MANSQIRNNDILDGTISGAKISASAAIDSSKVTPPGATNQIIFNSGGAFAASSALTWNGGALAVNGTFNAGLGAFGAGPVVDTQLFVQSSLAASGGRYKIGWFKDANIGGGVEIHGTTGGLGAVQGVNTGGSAANLAINPLGGFVGVGLAVPTQKFHARGDGIVGTFRFDSGPFAVGFEIEANDGPGTTKLSWKDASNVTRFDVTGRATGTPSTDTWKIGHQGSVKVTVVGTGRVGIGTETPQKLLDLEHATDATLRLYDIAFGNEVNLISAGGSARLYTVSAHPLLLGTSNAERIRIAGNGAEVVINDNGNDADFRVEGDTRANLLTVDAGTDTVTIGSNTFTGTISGGLTINTAAAAAANGDTILAVTDNNSATFRLAIASNVAQLAVNAGQNMLLGNKDSVQGAFTEFMRIHSSGIPNAVIVNESGRDQDFRLEGDTDTQLIFADASADRVGIGTLTPGFKLDVAGSLGAGSAAQFQVDASGDLIRIKSLTYSWPAAHGSSGYVLTNNGSGTLSWAAGGGGVTGSGVANQVTYWSGASALTGDASYTFSPAAGLSIALPASASPGVVSMIAASNNTNGAGGQISLTAGAGVGAFAGGDVVLTGGNTAVASGNAPGSVRLLAGNNSAGSAGSRITVANALTLTGSAEPGVDMTLTFPGTNDTGRIFLNAGFPNGSIRLSTGILALVIDAAGLSTFSGNVAATTYLAVGGATMGSGTQRIKLPDASFIVWETSSAKIGAGATNMVLNAATGANSVLVNYGGGGAAGSGGLVVYDGAFPTSIVKFRVDTAGTNSHIVGRFGVGTVSAPSTALHVGGSIRMVDGNQQTGYVMTSDANGVATWTAPVASSAVGQWTKYTKTFTDFSTAATTNSIALLTLPIKGVVEDVVIKHTTAFSGGAISAYTVSVGISGTLAKYATAFDVFQAVADTTAQISAGGFVENFGSTTSVLVTAVSTGANLNAAGAGSVDIWVKTSTLP